MSTFIGCSSATHHDARHGIELEWGRAIAAVWAELNAMQRPHQRPHHRRSHSRRHAPGSLATWRARMLIQELGVQASATARQTQEREVFLGKTTVSGKIQW